MNREPAGYALPRFSVTKPVTVTMILLAILVVGLIAYIRVPIAMFPEGMENNALYVWVQYPNATPRDIEEKIARPLEDIIGTVPNVKKVNSYSSTGSCSVRIEFQHGTSLRTAYAHVSDRMDRVKPSLPSDVDRINVRRWDQSDIPIMALVAGVPVDMDDAYYRIDNYVKPALQRIEGVGNVEIWGIQTRNVFIDLSEERLRSHRVDVTAMLNTLRNQNFALSGGYIVEGGRKIYVRSLGRLESTEQIGSLIVDADRRLRLRDVAEITLRVPKRDWMFRVDGKPAIGLEITRDSTGNIERISREVRATLAQLADQPQLASIKFNVFWDQGRYVKEGIENLQSSGLWGGLFAAMILYLFLRAPRMTAILTLSIPLSLLCTLIVLFFAGWSLNMATMMGLLLSVGMVVDNSIVIVENIYRHRQEGRDATAASIAGAGEVALAVVLSTLTSVVVFLPLMLMKQSGDFSFWMMRIGIPVIMSLLASLFIALVFVPLAAERLTRSHQHQELRVLQWIRAWYLTALRWVLAHRLNAALLVLVAGATPWLPFKGNKLARPVGGGGGPNENTMWMYFDLPSGNTFEDADAFFTKVESFIQANLQRYNFERVETRFRYNNGRLQMKFRDDPNDAWYAYTWDSLLKWMKFRPAAMDGIAIEKEFREKFPLPPGITMRTNQRGSNQGPQDSNLYLSLYGEDTGLLMDLAEEAARRLRTIPGLISVDTDTERGGNELRIQIDRDRARRLGVDPRMVSNNIAYAMRGMEVGRYYSTDGRELRITAQLGDADRASLDDVRSMSFPTEGGVDVPLETLADLHVSRTLGQIQRENRQTILRVVARAPRGDSSKLFGAIDKAMEGFEMPHGYRWDKGGGGLRIDEDESERKFAIILATTFVFLLMGLLFESFILPLAVIIAVPLAGLGVYWTLFFTGTPLDVMAGIGIVVLVGVVVNNGIVLVDMTNRLRLEGHSRLEALLEAGKHRFRPIMMTTLTTVCGLIPMALGNSKMIGMPYAPLGRTMIGGLMASTLLTLVVVPLFYTLLDDLRTHAERIARSAFARKAGASGAATAPAGAAAGVGRAQRAE
jgi:hydrophobic/amphiphilic exporter-1 (mainly G- bacteria), HAE1 family